MELETPNRHIVIGTEPWTRYSGIEGARAATGDVSEDSSIWPYLNRQFGRLSDLRIKANPNLDERIERDGINANLDNQFTPAGRDLVEREWIRRTHPFSEFANRQIARILESF